MLRSSLAPVLAVVACLAASPAAAQDPAPRAEPAEQVPGREEILAIIDAFHAALAEGDSTAALALLHPGVTIYESGHAENLEQYRSGHLDADIEFARTVRSTVVDEWVGMSDRHSIVGRVYSAKGTFRDRDVDAITAETMFLLQRDDGEWRIRHIHWSSRRASPPSGP